VASGFARAGVGISAVGRIDELARRTWLFIKKCLYNDSRSVSSVAQHAIYHRWGVICCIVVRDSI